MGLHGTYLVTLLQRIIMGINATCPLTLLQRSLLVLFHFICLVVILQRPNKDFTCSLPSDITTEDVRWFYMSPA